ncbi:MAG: sucrose phosphorylase [Nitrososphaerales archaeon]
MSIRHSAQLITYPDSLGGDLAALNRFLDRHLRAVFGGVHILPPFPSSGDRGFAPTTYRDIDPAFGTWGDLRAIGQDFDLTIDLMINHISRRSPEFLDFLARGRASEFADLFITLDKVWPGGEPRPEDVAKIFLRRPKAPFSTVTIAATGESEPIWTTFGRTEPSEQIDLDLRSPLTRRLLADHLRFFSAQNVRIVRLDAIGYVVKQPGTSCFMVEPEIFEVLDWLTAEATTLGLTLLPEVHAAPQVQSKLAGHGYWVYDFVLPLLVLHTLTTGSAEKLRWHLRTCPRRQFTMLDCHDGIPVQPDLDGVLTTAEMRAVADHCLARGANLSRLLSTSGKPAPGFDAHQVNITYYSALGEDDAAYLTARALQLFAPGIPQVYYVGLLAGANDVAAVAASGEGRDINRHNYTLEEAEVALTRPVVQQLLRLVQLRSEHPAFGGELAVLDGAPHVVQLEWRQGEAYARLEVDLHRPTALVSYSDPERLTHEERIG